MRTDAAVTGLGISLIEEAALARAVDHRPDELQIFHRTLKLGSAGVGACHRQGRKAGEALGMFGDDTRQIVVDPSSKRVEVVVSTEPICN